MDDKPITYTPSTEETNPLVPQAAVPQTNDQGVRVISWTASEFVAHDKSAGWYAQLGLITLIIAALVLLITRDYISVGVIVVSGLLLGVYGARKPREVAYRIDDHGIGIGRRHYGYNEFRSFAIMREGVFANIALVPLKRFSPLLTMYYAPNDEDAIVSVLSGYLPLENRKPDAIDKLMRRIRF